MKKHFSPAKYLSKITLGVVGLLLVLAPTIANAAMQPTKANLAKVGNAAAARDFFFGDPKSSAKALANYCPNNTDTSRPDCRDASENGPYLRVFVQRPGNPKIAAAIFPLVALASSASLDDNERYNLWIFRSEDNPNVAVGYIAVGGTSAPSTFAYLPADPATDKASAKALKSPTPEQWINEIKIEGGIDLPNDLQSGASGIVSKYNLKSFDTGDNSSPLSGAGNSILNKSMQSVQDIINSLLTSIANQYSKLVDSLLTNDYLQFTSPNDQDPVTNVNAAAVDNHSSSPTTPVVGLWTFTRDLANIFFLALLLIIAFSNVLHLESYAIRALLPRFVLAVVTVNLSLMIAQIVLDAVSVLTVGFLGDMHFGPIVQTLIGSGGIVAGASGGALFFSTFLLITVAMAVLTVVAMLIARIVVIWFLVAVAPIAFLLGVLPATRGLYSQWWKTLYRFALIAPIMALVLRLASELSNATLSASASEGAGLLRATLIVALIFLSGVIPVMVGGKIMGTVQSWVKKRGEGLRKGALERSPGKQMMNQVSSQFANRAELKGAELSDALGALTAGRVGTHGAHGSILMGQAKKKEGEMDSLLKDEKSALARNRNVDEAVRYAAAESLAKAELLDADDILDLHSYLSRRNWGKLNQAMSEKNLDYLADHRVQRLLNENRDFVMPKFITDESGTAQMKHVIRLNEEGLLKLGATQLRQLPAHLKRELHLSETAFQTMNQRQMDNFITATAAHEVSVLTQDSAWNDNIRSTLETALGRVANSQELRDAFEDAAVKEAAKRDTVNFANLDASTQHNLIRNLRDPGVPSEERDRGAESARINRTR